MPGLKREAGRPGTAERLGAAFYRDRHVLNPGGGDGCAAKL